MSLKIFPFVNKKNNEKIVLPSINIEKKFTKINIDKTTSYGTYYLNDDKELLEKLKNNEFSIRKLREIVKELSIKGVSLYSKEKLQKFLIDYYEKK